MTESKSVDTPPNEGGIFLSKEEYEKVSELVAEFPRIADKGLQKRQAYPFINLYLIMWILSREKRSNNQDGFDREPYRDFCRNWMQQMREEALYPIDVSGIVRRVSSIFQNRLLYSSSVDDAPVIFDLAGKEYIALCHPSLKSLYLCTEEEGTGRIVSFTEAQLSAEHDRSARYASTEDHIAFLSACVLSVEF